MRFETIAVEQAVGHVLSHDVTRIVKDQVKGPLMRRGQVIQATDIPALKQAGKDHVYILVLEADDMHEDEAAMRLGQAAAGPGLKLAGPKEGRVNLIAEQTGVLKVNRRMLLAVNALPNVVLATLPNNRLVAANTIVAGTKVIPLTVKEELVEQAEALMAAGPLLAVKPLQTQSAGLVITGREIYSGLIEDAFAPVLTDKLATFGSRVQAVDFAPDDATMIAALIGKQIAAGCDLIMVTGGMSVDPDDVTPAGVRMAGAKIVQYGAPVMPGAMFMLAYLQDVPILGVPACGMFFRTTVLDLVLPRVLAGERIHKRDIVSLAHGGLCSACQPCTFPKCTFGTGGLD